MFTYPEYIESDHPIFIQIKNLCNLTPSRLEYLSYLYRFYPCTNNELIENIKKERPDLNQNELMAFNKQSNDLKENGTVHVLTSRSCQITGEIAQVLAPTFEHPCSKGMKVFAKKFEVSKEEIETNLTTVALGFQKSNKRKVAIKYCKHKRLDIQKRFRKEIEYLVQLQGANEVVDILEYDLDHFPPYYVMPLAELGDLRSLQNKLKNNFTLQKRIFNRVLDCIEFLHSKGVIHRDIKPHNFLAFSEDDIKVIDFGIARQPMDDTTRVTISNAQWGTEQFAPPEFWKVKGFKEAGPQWDTYSLAATFFNLCTGLHVRTFEETDDIPIELFEIFKKGLSHRLEERYQSVQEFRDGLNKVYNKIILEEKIYCNDSSKDLYSLSF